MSTILANLNATAGGLSILNNGVSQNHIDGWVWKILETGNDYKYWKIEDSEVKVNSFIPARTHQLTIEATHQSFSAVIGIMEIIVGAKGARIGTASSLTIPANTINPLSDVATVEFIIKPTISSTSIKELLGDRITFRSVDVRFYIDGTFTSFAIGNDRFNHLRFIKYKENGLLKYKIINNDIVVLEDEGVLDLPDFSNSIEIKAGATTSMPKFYFLKIIDDGNVVLDIDFTQKPNAFIESGTITYDTVMDEEG